MNNHHSLTFSKSSKSDWQRFHRSIIMNIDTIQRCDLLCMPSNKGRDIRLMVEGVCRRKLNVHPHINLDDW